MKLYRKKQCHVSHYWYGNTSTQHAKDEFLILLFAIGASKGGLKAQALLFFFASTHPKYVSCICMKTSTTRSGGRCSIYRLLVLLSWRCNESSKSIQIYGKTCISIYIFKYIYIYIYIYLKI